MTGTPGCPWVYSGVWGNCTSRATERCRGVENMFPQVACVRWLIRALGGKLILARAQWLSANSQWRNWQPTANSARKKQVSIAVGLALQAPSHQSPLLMKLKVQRVYGPSTSKLLITSQTA